MKTFWIAERHYVLIEHHTLPSSLSFRSGMDPHRNATWISWTFYWRPRTTQGWDWPRWRFVTRWTLSCLEVGWFLTDHHHQVIGWLCSCDCCSLTKERWPEYTRKMNNVFKKKEKKKEKKRRRRRKTDRYCEHRHRHPLLFPFRLYKRQREITVRTNVRALDSSVPTLCQRGSYPILS